MPPSAFGGFSVRVLPIALTLILVCPLNGCGNASQINARSVQTVKKSVSYIKEHLPADQRLPFEASYWLIRDQIKKDDDFLQAVNGKTAEELIAMGKENFNQRKAAGEKGYAEFESWEQMISHSEQQRAGLTNSDKTDARDKKGYPRVDYKMHAM